MSGPLNDIEFIFDSYLEKQYHIVNSTYETKPEIVNLLKPRNALRALNRKTQFQFREMTFKIPEDNTQTPNERDFYDLMIASNQIVKNK